MHAIVSHQREFFEDGDEQLLHPMILKDIADDTGIDISSVSRASQSKYVSTPYGTFPLKYFFNNSFVSSTGTTMSKNQIKTTLRTLIEGEDKAHPLADEDLARELKQAGLEVARRTIAKYREQMGFPVARLRKQ